MNVIFFGKNTYCVAKRKRVGGLLWVRKSLYPVINVPVRTELRQGQRGEDDVKTETEMESHLYQA